MNDGPHGPYGHGPHDQGPYGQGGPYGSDGGHGPYPGGHAQQGFHQNAPGTGAGGHWYAGEYAPYATTARENPGVSTGVVVAITLLVVVILVVTGLIIFRLVSGGSAPGQGPLAAEEQAASGGAASEGTGGEGAAGEGTTAEDEPTATGTTTETTSSQEPTTNAEARERLDDYISAGESRAERVEYSWVPQLSSKRDGLTAEGRTWDHLAILEEFEDFRARYPDATLLRSSDWGVFEPGWYVTIVADPSSDYDTVLRWCRNQGYSSDHCLAKNLQRDGTVQGTTRTN